MYEIASQLYLNTQTQCYDRVITINTKPEGPLQSYVSQLHKEKLSPYQSNQCEPCYQPCFYALKNPKTGEFYCINQIAELVEFLLTNDYTIDYNLSTLMTKNTRVNSKENIIFYITYDP